MSETDLAFAPLVSVAQRLKAGEITSLSLTRLMLDRIKRLNSTLNCYVTVREEQALDEAEGLDRLLKAGTSVWAPARRPGRDQG